MRESKALTCELASGMNGMVGQVWGNRIGRTGWIGLDWIGLDWIGWIGWMERNILYGRAKHGYYGGPSAIGR